MTSNQDTSASLKDKEPTISLGNFLQRERQKKKLSIQEISVATKVPEDALVAIETGNKKHLPVAVFAKGFVKIYANYLGLDQNDILKRFQKEWDIPSVNSTPEMLHEESMAQLSPFYLSFQFYLILATIALFLGLAYFFFNANAPLNEEISVNKIRSIQTLPASITPKDTPISIAKLKSTGNQHHQPLISPQSAGKISIEGDEDVVIACLPSVIIVKKQPRLVPKKQERIGIAFTSPILHSKANQSTAMEDIVEILPEDRENVSPSLALPLDLHIAFLARTRISISQDDGSPAKYIFSRGEESTWSADKTISMQVEEADNIRITLNGKIIPLPKSEGTPLAITLPKDLSHL